MTRFWNLKKTVNEAEGPLAPEDGVLDIDGEIVAEEGWFLPDGVCVARNFRKALNGVRNVTVHINSPGGDVMAGAEIYSALREHSLNGKGTVTVIVTGLAASAASVVAMAGDRILMHPVAYMMIHNPWTFAMGDAKELRKTAKVLDVISEGLISAYERRTGKDRDELKRMLENETWMSAGTAVEEGFADGIYGAEAGAAASLVRPTMMSAKAHGLQEILQRIRAEDPEEEEKDPPEEEPEEEPKDPPEDPEEDPEEEPEEDPEEKAKRAAIRERATIAAAALAAAGY